MKKLIFLAMCLIVMSGCGSDSSSKGSDDANREVTLVQFETAKTGDQIAIMETNMGTITMRLFPEQAPKAVENFVTHAKDGYYNNVSFHRVIQDFMIQGGDPLGSGRGGESIWGKAFEDEFSDELYNFRGAVSMANSGVNTNGSQFFIVQNSSGSQYTDAYFKSFPSDAKTRKWPNADFVHPIAARQKYAEIGGVPYLDHMHTVFAQVIEGMDIVDAIASSATDNNDKPVNEVLIKQITIETQK